MTTNAALTAAHCPGRLLLPEQLVPGQFIYVRPLSRSGLEWCEVRGVKRLRVYVRIDLLRADGLDFWYRLLPGEPLRTLDVHPSGWLPEVTVARSRLRLLFPETEFTARTSSGAVMLRWTDGPSVAEVMRALVVAGVTHVRCDRTISGATRATAIVRQAREDSLPLPRRHAELLDDLTTFTPTERALGRQLCAFAGGAEDRESLAAAVVRFGLPVLAETAGVPCPQPLILCAWCQAAPQFTVRHIRRMETKPCCGSCLGRHGDAGVEILPLP